jgi:type I restriction enzyme S subunit
VVELVKTRLVVLGNVVEQIVRVDPAKLAEDTFSYVDLGSVDQGRKIIATEKSVATSEAPSRARQVLKSNDVLVSTVRPNLNGVARVPGRLDGSIASTGFCVLRPRAGQLDPNYLFHWVQSPVFVDDMVRKASGASYPAVSDKIVLGSYIPFPPLEEQQRIAAILDKADKLRTQRREALAKLDTLTQSVFNGLFGDALASTSTVVRDAGRVQLGRQRAPKYQSGEHTHPYMRVANVQLDRIDTGDVLSMDFDEKDLASYRLSPGDILLNEGQSTELVGRPAMWRGEIDDCCFQNTLIRFTCNEAKTLPEYALGVFLHYFRDGSFSRVSSKTSNVAHLGASRFADMPFPIPDLGLQRKYAQLVKAVDILKQQSRAQLIELEDLFVSLQHRAFQGELR